MTELAERFLRKYFSGQENPYRTFEKTVDSLLRPTHTLLDAGCGRTAPVLSKFRGRAARLIGIDLVDFNETIPDLELYKVDLAHIPIPDGTVNIIMARSVIEHIEDPEAVYQEFYRVFKSGGYLIFLTTNLWDYASLVAWLVPNRWHPWIVSKTEGRQEQDVFPIQYKNNTYRSVQKWCVRTGF